VLVSQRFDLQCDHHYYYYYYYYYYYATDNVPKCQPESVVFIHNTYKHQIHKNTAMNTNGKLFVCWFGVLFVNTNGHFVTVSQRSGDWPRRLRIANDKTMHTRNLVTRISRSHFFKPKTCMPQPCNQRRTIRYDISHKTLA